MFEVTEEASQKIKEFLKEQKDNQSIRVLMTEGGWRGPYLVMALDEKKADDEIFNVNGVTYLVEKKLLEKVKPIRIGYTHSTLGLGFTIDSEIRKMMEAKTGVTPGCHRIYSSCADANNCKD